MKSSHSDISQLINAMPDDKQQEAMDEIDRLLEIHQGKPRKLLVELVVAELVKFQTRH
jgi:hypothetical protein